MRSSTLEKVVSAAKKLADLAFARADGKADRMLEVRLHSPNALLNCDPMKAELRDLWNKEVAPNEQSLLQWVDTILGFELRFTLLHECGQTITGLVSVELTPNLA
ncbi:MAG TPA: hypothetical protein VHE55_01895 [Fimbriimonadaceae bacterium]|nr:hypothetical protein [Fimbriimonadaceae bacterium]